MGLLGVTVQDVENAIEAQNEQRGAGSVGTAPTLDDQQVYYTVTTPGRLLTPEQFGNIVINSKGPNGVVHMSDIARTEVGKRSDEFRVDVNGEPGVNMGVYLQTGANAMEAATAAKERLVELAKRFPKNRVDYLITDDTTVFVGASLNERLSHAGRSRPARAACGVHLSAELARNPHSDACRSRLADRHHGQTLAFRLFPENIERIMRTEGLSPYDAAQKAMKEVSGALVAIMLVLAAVFIPVAFLGGIAGELYRQFAVTVATSVVLSGFVALTLTPALCAILLKKPEEGSGGKLSIFRVFNAGLSRFTLVFLQLVTAALRHRIVTAVILAIVTFGCVEMLERTPTSFIPK